MRMVVWWFTNSEGRTADNGYSKWCVQAETGLCGLVIKREREREMRWGALVSVALEVLQGSCGSHLRKSQPPAPCICDDGWLSRERYPEALTSTQLWTNKSANSKSTCTDWLIFFFYFRQELHNGFIFCATSSFPPKWGSGKSNTASFQLTCFTFWICFLFGQKDHH